MLLVIRFLWASYHVTFLWLLFQVFPDKAQYPNDQEWDEDWGDGEPLIIIINRGFPYKLAILAICYQEWDEDWGDGEPLILLLTGASPTH